MSQRPIDFRCPRCGASEGWPCEPIRDGKYPTVLRMHSERGAMPWWLERNGYQPYTVVDPDGFTFRLWRKPRQPALDREGWRIA